MLIVDETEWGGKMDGEVDLLREMEGGRTKGERGIPCKIRH